MHFFYMKKFCLLILSIVPLSATYIVMDKQIDDSLQNQVFDLLLKSEPPRLFYDPHPLDIEKKCLNLNIQIQWVPPTIWQLSVLHAFFHNEHIRSGILGCLGPAWDPPGNDKELHLCLASSSTIQQVVEYFDKQTRSIPHLYQLFFEINSELSTLYKRSDGSDMGIVQLILSELPPFNEWEDNQFPFWLSPWIYNKDSIRFFYNTLQNTPLILKCAELERIAYEKGEWVLYRGYQGVSTPSTLHNGSTESHALSFGSTLLGGSFFSLESTALTYASPQSFEEQSFLALSLTPEEMKALFRVGPLHPFVQMIMDGEMFHAHTKIAASTPIAYQQKPLKGYFMQCNQYCYDPVEYILYTGITPEELEDLFISLCKKSGYVFKTNNAKN